MVRFSRVGYDWKSGCENLVQISPDFLISIVDHIQYLKREERAIIVSGMTLCWYIKGSCARHVKIFRLCLVSSWRSSHRFDVCFSKKEANMPQESNHRLLDRVNYLHINSTCSGDTKCTGSFSNIFLRMHVIKYLDSKMLDSVGKSLEEGDGSRN